MPNTRPIRLRFPAGGVAKRHGYEYQPQHTTPSALNVWPMQASTGRYRGGVRPGLATLGSIGAAPYGWCRASYYRSGSRSGVAVAHAAGVSVSTNGTSWSTEPGITRAPGTDFTSCAIHDSILFQAVGGADCYFRDLSAGGQGVLGTGAPQNCGIALAMMDRLWLAGDTDNPNTLYASKIAPDGNWGDPSVVDPGANENNNWDYSATDAGGAFASGGTNGVIASNITALLNHGFNCLIIGHTDGITVLSGNPRAGGFRRVISQHHGPLNQNCWCKDDADNSWFLSRAGLYRIGSGCINTGANIESMSRERLPKGLFGIDPGAGDVAHIGYDIANRGIHIHVDRATGTDESWFFDIMDGGFWPVSYPDKIRLSVPLPDVMDEDKSALLAITSSGSVKQFDSTVTSDYGTAIDSHLYVGPIKLGSDDRNGIMADCYAVLAEDSGNVAWSVAVGESAQQAFAATPWFTGQNWTRQGLNHRQHPRARGHSAYLKLEDASGSVWSFEEIVCNVQDGGPRRVYA